MFGNESLPSQNWLYGAKKPDEGLDLVLAQFHHMRMYRNALVKLELDRRESSTRVMFQHHPEVMILEASLNAKKEELEKVRAKIKSVKSSSRTSKVPKDLAQQATQLRKDLGVIAQNHKDAKAIAWQDASMRGELDAIDADHLAACKLARKNSKLYWGSYLHVEQGLQSIRKGPPPQFRYDTSSAKIAVQIQGGMTWADLVKCDDNRIRLYPGGARKILDANGKQKINKGNGQPMFIRAQPVLWIRVGSDKGKPVWAKVRVHIHREPPSHARIKWVYLIHESHDAQQSWSVLFTLSDSEGWSKGDNAKTGHVGIDLGWRLKDNGDLRVAYWMGSGGEEGEVVIPQAIYSRIARADELRGIRAAHFDFYRNRLAEWMRRVTSDARHSVPLPPWLVERTRYLPQWKTPARLALLLRTWRENRFAGDEVIFAELQGHLVRPVGDEDGSLDDTLPHYEGWRGQNQHLWSWEKCQRAKYARRRKRIFRNFVAMLRRKYRTAHIEEIDWRTFQRDAPPESSEVKIAEVRARSRLASVGKLAAFIAEGMQETVRHDPAETTSKCCRCGHVNEFDRFILCFTCAQCGATHDQDRNAAINLLLASGEVTNESLDAAREP